MPPESTMEGQNMQEQHPIPASKGGLVIPYRALLGVLGVLAVAGVVILILWQTNVLFSSATKSNTPTGPVPSISFHYPKTWSLLPKSQWAKVGAPAGAAAVLQRINNSANLVVLRGGKVTINSKTAQKINNQLQKKYSDYKFLHAQKIKLPNITAQAMLFSYGRTKQGILHTITIIPAAPISFVIETASPPNNKGITKQIGTILKSARLSYKKK